MSLFLVVVGLTSLAALGSAARGVVGRADGRAIGIGLVALLVCASLFLLVLLRGLDCIS